MTPRHSETPGATKKNKKQTVPRLKEKDAILVQHLTAVAGKHRTTDVGTTKRGRTGEPKICLLRHQLLTNIYQLQQLLKVQETHCVEGIQNMRSWLTTLQTAIIKAAPEAHTVSCPALDDPPDGKKYGSKYLVGHEVHFSCNYGFQLVGPSSVVCLANGTWTEAQPHCKAIHKCSSQPCHNGGTCVEDHKHYRCICPPGTTGNHCQHQTQTAAPEGGVIRDLTFSHPVHCVQVDWVLQCSCEVGFEMKGTGGSNSTCQDVNECEVYGRERWPRLCRHACVNTPGSYLCICPSGYRLMADGKNCEDIDECAGGQHKCPRETTCINTRGGFQCVSPKCPKDRGNITYVKTSSFQCKRNHCPMHKRMCRRMPNVVAFHYLSLPSKRKTPFTISQMAVGSISDQTHASILRFVVTAGNKTDHFLMQQTNEQTGELILLQPLEGPQTLEVDVEVLDYRENILQASYLCKITIFVSPYEY
ncbi:fibulin-7 [Acomys russatus]|uniref:fibulin-7 n=1 Tax=Acomys russatus TaxID=60746 RepID=UPI0021E1E76E|nr:fibulin-7 [Acomys russatus]